MCSHLSRKFDCREWYCNNLKKELIKAEEKRKRLDLPRPPALPPKQFSRLGSASNVSSPGSSRPSPSQSPASNAGSVRKGGKPLGVSMPLSDRLARCSKCKKVFGGKSPFVAFRNHLRGAPACANHAMKPEIIVQPNVVKAFQKQFETSATGSQTNKQNLQTYPRTRDMKDPQRAGKLPTREAILTGTKYYCKLCEKIKYCNRVQLGVHLTQHHSLPPVNCDPDKKNEQFRCQNCHKIFNSKYFYNCHRRDCDIDSPYIGVIDEDGNLITSKQQLDAAEERADNFPRSAPRVQASGSLVARRSGLPPTQKELQVMNNKKPSAYFNYRYKCSLCLKVGFNGPNAVKIHQKYQCVNRNLVTHPTGSLAGIRNKNQSQSRRPYQLPIPNRLKLETYVKQCDLSIFGLTFFLLVLSMMILRYYQTPLKIRRRQ